MNITLFQNACSCWSPLASYPSQNKSQDCYHRFQGIAFPATILSRCLVSRYVPTRSLRSPSSLSICIPSRKIAMTRSKSFSSVASDIWNRLSSHLSSISALPAFKKKRQASSFFKCFPLSFLSIHWNHALWCHHSICCSLSFVPVLAWFSVSGNSIRSLCKFATSCIGFLWGRGSNSRCLLVRRFTNVYTEELHLTSLRWCCQLPIHQPCDVYDLQQGATWSSPAQK